MTHDSELSIRVAALERQNTLLRRYVGLATLCAFTLPVLAAFAPPILRAPQELKAERFVLVDSNGDQRAALELDKATARLAFKGAEGVDRLQIGADPQTAFVILKDDQAHVRLGLAVDAYPHLMMHDELQRPRIHASVGVNGASSLLFHDDHGFPLGMGIDGKGKIWRKPEIDQQQGPAVTEPQKAVVPPSDTDAGKKRDD